MDKEFSRRSALRMLAAAPFGAALACCGDAVMMGDAGRDAAGAGSLDAGALDAGICEPTTRDALGPFLEDGAPMRMLLAGPDEPGERLLVEGLLLDAADCTRPLGGHVVDIWQTDTNGNYYQALSTAYRLRGRMATGADGRFAIETIKPGFYDTSTGPRPGSSRRSTSRVTRTSAPPTAASLPPASRTTPRASCPACVGGVNGVRGTLRLVVPS